MSIIANYLIGILVRQGYEIYFQGIVKADDDFWVIMIARILIYLNLQWLSNSEIIGRA